MSEKSGSETSSESTLSAVGSHAKTYQLPGTGAVWRASDRGCSSMLFELYPNYVPRSWYSKTSPAYFRRTKGGTWESSSERWQTQGIAAHGECWTRNGSESPNDAVVCSLSDILMRNVPQRYYLSQRAARGILRRCEKRGRTLPTQLTAALEELAGRKIKRHSSPTRLQVKGTTPAKTEPGEGRHSSSTANQAAPSDAKGDKPLLSTRTSEASSPSTTRVERSDAGAESQGKDIQPLLSTMQHTTSTDADRRPADQEPIFTSHCEQERPGNQKDSARQLLLVRRLTPIECEILQGFPAGWTHVGTGNSETL